MSDTKPFDETHKEFAEFLGIEYVRTELYYYEDTSTSELNQFRKINTQLFDFLGAEIRVEVPIESEYEIPIRYQEATQFIMKSLWKPYAKY